MKNDYISREEEEKEEHPYFYLHGYKYCSVCGYEEVYFDTYYGQQLFHFCLNCGKPTEVEENEILY